MSRRFATLAIIIGVLAVAAPAMAADPGAASGDDAKLPWGLFAPAIAIGLAAFGGSLGQGKGLAAACEAIGRNPGADIIYDVKCSRHLNSLISDLGGRPIMWKTGHSFIKAKMKETGALIAGEMSVARTCLTYGACASAVDPVPQPISSTSESGRKYRRVTSSFFS